jgi:carboxypeptidase C (cathepsin A)
LSKREGEITREEINKICIKIENFLETSEKNFFRDFYIFGESYGGKYVPALTHRIHLTKSGIGKGKICNNSVGQILPIQTIKS